VQSGLNTAVRVELMARQLPSCFLFVFFGFFSGTVRRASARPYYDKTQRMPHAQSDRDVAHLTKLTAVVEGRKFETGGGFLSHRMFNNEGNS
jgi:hypothetical protein